MTYVNVFWAIVASQVSDVAIYKVVPNNDRLVSYLCTTIDHLFYTSFSLGETLQVTTKGEHGNDMHWKVGKNRLWNLPQAKILAPWSWAANKSFWVLESSELSVRTNHFSVKLLFCFFSRLFGNFFPRTGSFWTWNWFNFGRFCVKARFDWDFAWKRSMFNDRFFFEFNSWRCTLALNL